LEDCHQLVAQSPEFIRIFQAWWLISIYNFPLRAIFYTHLLLDVSWDQILATFSGLWSIIGGKTPKQIFGGATAIFAVTLELCDIGIAVSNLAQCFLHLVQRVGSGDLTLDMW
jgi:hypothetical protein